MLKREAGHTDYLSNPSRSFARLNMSAPVPSQSITTSFAFCLLAIMPTSLLASSFTIDQWLVTVGIIGGNTAGGSLAGTPNPFLNSHMRTEGNSIAAAEYDFAWSGMTGRFLIETMHASETAGGNTIRPAAGGQIELTVTEPISILVDAELNFDLPMDQMRAGMSVSYFGINGTPGGGGQGFNYNTIFGTGPNSFAYQTQFDLMPGQYRLGYNMDIDATPSSAGAVGTANGFVEFQIVPESTMTLPMMLCTAVLTRRRFRRRAGAMPTQPN